MFSTGNWGNELDGQNIHAAPQAASSDSDEEAELLPKEQEKPNGAYVSTTPPMKPVTVDNNYWYLPFEANKPIVYLKFNTEDHRRRFYNQNILYRIINMLVCINKHKGASSNPQPHSPTYSNTWRFWYQK